MKVIRTKIEGVVIIEPQVFFDGRGYFFESFSQQRFNELVSPTVFVQDNESQSTYGVLRGLHFQKPPFAQAKLVRVVKGEVLDVAVDLREGSPTFGQYESVILNEENKRQFFIPRGFAHGFATLTPNVNFMYKCDNYYNVEADTGIIFDDKDLGIDWQIDLSKAIISEKDKKLPTFKEFEKSNDFVYGEV